MARIFYIIFIAIFMSASFVPEVFSHPVIVVDCAAHPFVQTKATSGKNSDLLTFYPVTSPLKSGKKPLSEPYVMIMDALELPEKSESGACKPLKHRPVDSEIQSIVKKYSEIYGVDSALVLAVMQAESGFNPDAVSPAGAIGLMQLMPETAASLGVDPWDVTENIRGGIVYLRDQFNRFGDVRLALAAYNAGPGAVEKYGGIPPYKETVLYVETVLSIYNSRK